jgi:hypothetical protein
VKDFFSVLSQRGLYPVRSNSASSLERLGLVEGLASRITVRGGAGLPLLDLLIGFGDAAGSVVYLRKSGSGEARSGDDVFTAYTETDMKSWFDLSLFQNISLDLVQRADITLPFSDEYFSLAREANQWILVNQKNSPAASQNAARAAVESWLRALLGAEGEDFLPRGKNFSSGVFFEEGRVLLELGNGTFLMLRIGAEDENGCRTAMVQGRDFIYLLSRWTLERIFRGKDFFAAP